jgi:hypothetical protein
MLSNFKPEDAILNTADKLRQKLKRDNLLSPVIKRDSKFQRQSWTAKCQHGTCMFPGYKSRFQRQVPPDSNSLHSVLHHNQHALRLFLSSDYGNEQNLSDLVTVHKPLILNSELIYFWIFWISLLVSYYERKCDYSKLDTTFTSHNDVCY